MVSRASHVGRGNKQPAPSRPIIWLCPLALMAPLLIAVVILSPLLAAEDRRFHPDEAFFMTFAREAAVKGDWWLSGPLDKPPLTIYAHAALLALIGTDTLPDGVLTLNPSQGEFVGRLLAFFSSLAVLALVIRLTLDLTQQPLAAVAAALSLTVLPLYQLYSAAAFMDMPMLALALGALLAARRQRAGASGVLLGLAICAKPQAVFFAPLVVWLITCPAQRWRRLLAWSAGAGGVLLLLWLWDALRPGDSVILLGAANNDNLTLVTRPDALLERLRAWLPTAHTSNHHLVGYDDDIGPLIAWGVICAAGLLSHQTRALGVWLLAYSGGHLLMFDALYERYLLPVAVVGVMSVWVAAAAWWRQHPEHHAWQRAARRAFTALLLAGLAVWLAFANGYHPRAGHDEHRYRPLWMLEDYRPNSPIAQVAADLNALPVATVIYDHWLGWLLNYYMGPWHNKRIVYYPSPDALIAGIRALDEQEPRYFLIPTDNAAGYGLSSKWSHDWRAWLYALERSFQIEELHGYGRIRLFRIDLN